MALTESNLKSENFYTLEEYLEMERQSLERHEYIDGKIVWKESGSGAHSDICTNLIGEVHLQTKKTELQVRVIATKVKSGSFTRTRNRRAIGMLLYPDLVVFERGKVEYHDEQKDIILNPKVVVEVLSESTELFDRNTKFQRYRMFNPTLTDYVLVSQDKPLVEHFIRQADESWKLFIHFGLEETLSVESIDCKLKLTDIYDRIEFSREALDFIEEVNNERLQTQL